MSSASGEFGPTKTPPSGADEIALQPLSSPQAIPHNPRAGQVRVIHDADLSDGPSKTRLTIGFILVVAAAATTFVPFDVFYDKLTQMLWSGEYSSTWWASCLEGAALVLAGIILLLPGGLCLRLSIPSYCYYLVTVSMIGLSVYCADLLLEANIPWSWMVLSAVALGYLIHACGKVAPLSVRGVIGWAVIGFCCFGCAQNWFDWSEYAPKLGDGAVGFIEEWGPGLFTWLTVLVLTAVGISCSKTKPIHFLNAGLLLALAYFCFQDGYVRMISFPELGEHISPLPKQSLENIEVWRWVVLGELVLLAAVLLHMAMGVGSLTVAFAVAWLALSIGVNKRLGSDAMLAYANAQNLAAGNESPVSIFRPASEEKGRTLTQEESRANVVKASVRLGVIFSWVYLTAILAGLVAVSGLRMLLLSKRARLWGGFALWFAFGLGMAWLWTVWPSAHDWEGRLQSLVVLGTHRYSVGLVALGFMALLGSWALWEGSRYESWLCAGIVAILVGTALTLVGIAVLINRGGFSPLPVWAYVVIAAGQSSMMWVLLMHYSLKARPPAAASNRLSR